VLIYWLDLGVAGAAWATVFSMALVSAATAYWLFITRRTYVSFQFRSFRFNRKIVLDIGKVGLPASVSQMSMSLMAFALTKIIATVAGPYGVAIYTTGWRVVSIAILPMLGMASAVTAVTGAAFGARDYSKLRTSYFFAVKVGVLAEGVLALLLFAFARQITWVFAWSSASRHLMGDLTVFLRIVWVVLPTAPIGMTSSAMFQGTGRGLDALVMTLIRTLAFTVPAAWLLGIHAGWGLRGVWIGIAAAGLAYMPIALGWVTLYIRNLKRLLA